MDLTTVARVKSWLGIANAGKPILAITRAVNGVVTCNNHGFQSNAEVAFSGILGMVELNGQIATITVLDANSFQLNIDTSSYGVYVAGGLLGADDVVLQRAVTGLSAGIQSVLSRIFASTAYSEIRNGNGKSEMMVLSDPIISVSSIAINGVSVAARTAPGQAGYAFDSDTIYLEGRVFDRGVQNVTLGYVGGFAATPADVEQDMTEAVAFLYKERGRIGLSSEGLANQNTSYLRDLPPHLIRRLNQYNRPFRPAA